MSVEIPKMAIAFGQYGIPQSDVIECRVHLGCTREVSSFDLLLQNWDGKYSPSGSIPLAVGMDGHIDIGRSTNVPQIITCRIESIKHESTPTEHYTRVSGRCWGERLFRRVFTGAFENMKGEDIVKYLLDYYVGLSHNRGGTELVENTDTTYTWLEYENTPVWDIIKYIAESADKNGVVGFDFRVAPDGKFEFFPKNSKTSSISLSEQIEYSEYRKDIFRIRNRIKVLGALEKVLPSDVNEDGLTEDYEGWYPYFDDHSVVRRTDHVTKDGEKIYTDSYSMHVYWSYGSTTRDRIGLYRVLPNTIKCREPDGFKKLRFWIKWQPFQSDINPTTIQVRLHKDADNYYYRELLYDLVDSPNTWKKIELSLEEYWAPYGSPDWNNINRIGFYMQFPESGGLGEYAMMWVDHILFENCRFSSTVEDTNSQSLYGLRELTETDEELYSDYECQLRARALLAHLKDPAEYIVVRSTVLDYGNTPILPGDKIYIQLPNEGISGYYRVETAQYYVDAKTQTLEVTLELGKAPPLLADYLYGLRSTTVTVEKLSRTKLGRGAVPTLKRA
ncbi:MAG: hypothetical protein QW270_03775 [Candidatus Bathyarchaeia archaeon]